MLGIVIIEIIKAFLKHFRQSCFPRLTWAGQQDDLFFSDLSRMKFFYGSLHGDYSTPYSEKVKTIPEYAP